MATAQVQKTTQTAISQKQSQEVVQTMLHGGLSTLAYCRCFFDPSAFEPQILSASDAAHSYQDYAAGRLNPTSKGDHATTSMMRLTRGRSRRVNTLLDWLEKDAFVALKAGQLHSLHVHVHPSQAERERVLEAYTFTIKYDKVDGEPSPVGLTIDQLDKSMPTVETSNNVMQNSLRQIMIWCDKLPDLPPSRFISMRLDYTEDPKKKTFKPKGFVADTTKGLQFAQADGWTANVETLRPLDLGLHDVTLRVAHLQRTEDDDTAPFLPEDPAELSYRPIVATSTPPDLTVDLQKQINAEEQKRFSSLGALEPEQRAGASERAESRTSLTSNTNRRQSDGFNESQSTINTAAMKDFLKQTMLSEQISQGDTQPRGQVHLGSGTPTTMTATPSRHSRSSSRANDFTSRYSLTVERLAELIKKKSSLAAASRKIAHIAPNRDLILCQCGNTSEDESEMVQCVMCKTWQHLACYGYIHTDGDPDERLPDEHACYHCLLAGSEDHLLVQLKALVQRRRVMFHALKYGLTTPREVAARLDIDLDTTGHIFKHLRDNAYVVAAKGSKSRGYQGTKQPLFVPVRSGSGHEDMLQAFFDPLVLIDHHYNSTVSDANKLSKKALALQAEEMPPPVIPASQLRKKTAPRQASIMAPPKTPVRNLSTPRQRKRRHDDDPGEEITPIPRRSAPSTVSKRFKSVQSALLLDASGLASSPSAFDYEL